MAKRNCKWVGNQKGFTLVELMIVVAIIGLLAAIAIPQFLRFSFASKRAEARVLLSAIRNGQNAYFGSNDHFAGDNSVNSTQIINDEIGIGYLATGKFYTIEFNVTNPDPGGDPKSTLDYIAYAYADIDGDGDLFNDRFFVKNRYPLYASAGDNRVEHQRDDITNKNLIVP